MPARVRSATAADILRFRQARKWSQQKAAAWWGCSARTWRRWERDEATPPAALLKRLHSTRSTPRDP